METYVPYQHKAQYYETDQMGIIHHSNYIRWFEEARIDFMNQIGFGYDVMEAQGIVSPVLSVEAEYKSMVLFGDTVTVRLCLQQYNGVKMTLSYRVEDAASGELRCLGASSHCFLNREGRPVSLKRSAPKFDELFRAAEAKGKGAGQ